MTIAEFLALTWLDDGEPLIAPRFPSPILADPSFLFPSETPDGRWRLFAHDAFGIRSYDSSDGLSWRDRGMAVPNAMRAFVRKIDGRYALLYEKYRPFALPLQLLPRRPRWQSRIESRWSDDLACWTKPRRLLEADFPWARDGRLGESVSNPCLVPAAGGWRLWFSASLVTIPDCGFDEPRYIGCADAATPEGPFVASAAPIIGAEGTAADAMAVGAGSIKVLELDDGWIGLQNRISADRGSSAGSDLHSSSAIFVLRSTDGTNFRLARKEPLLAPSSGWRASHVYACDCRRDPASGAWYLYYNARDGWYKTRGRERIGRIVAR